MRKIAISDLSHKKFIVFVCNDQELFFTWKSLFSELLRHDFIVMCTHSLTDLPEIPKGFKLSGVLVLSYLYKFSNEVNQHKIDAPFLLYLQTSEFDGVPKQNVTEVLHFGRVNAANLYQVVSKYV